MELQRLIATAVLVSALGAALSATVTTSAASDGLVISEYKPDEQTWCEIRDEWVEDLLATHEHGTWATMKFEPTDEQLRKLGLPGSEFLKTHRFPQPTLVFPDGTMVVLPDLPGLDENGVPMQGTAGTVAYAGAGCFGIRPGALLLTVTNSVIGWCSMAHVYGTPGSYDISTAGHCGGNGDIATVIAGTGNRAGVTGVVLLDFGRYGQSTGDGGIGRDWALIDIDAPWQKLVSPTMCFWGGPIGMYEKTGATVAVELPRRIPGNPSITTNPDPLLVQGVVHYGHGTGVGGPGVGTPRVGTTFYWGATTMIWEGVITPGDSGSGSNTVAGDSIGAHREAAGINTHIFVDGSLKTGIGLLASTRATAVSGTLANGQLVPYPVPLPGAP